MLEGDVGPYIGTWGPGWELGDPTSGTTSVMENRFAQNHHITKRVPAWL